MANIHNSMEPSANGGGSVSIVAKSCRPNGRAMPHFRENPLVFIDESLLMCYNPGKIEHEEAFSMENKPKKIPCCTGLLAHV